MIELLNCNPNVIEILGTSEDHLFVLTEEGKLLRDNAGLLYQRKPYVWRVCNRTVKKT